jgi:iron complex transport system substrate-binding protein
VCLTPSSTELVAALGATGEIVGVDRYSVYPAQVGHLPKVGDFLSPNMEAILALDPDIVVHDAVQDRVGARLRSAGITSISLRMHSLADVRAGLRSLGASLGRTAESAEVIAALDRAAGEAAGRAKAKAAAASKPLMVLVVVDRQSPGLGGIVGGGPGTFVAELLAILGAQNVLAEAPLPYPTLSAEDIITLAPDVILDAAHTSDAERSLADWQLIASVPAVKNRRVHVLGAAQADGSAAILSPSPRLAEVLARLEPLLWP